MVTEKPALKTLEQRRDALRKAGLRVTHLRALILDKLRQVEHISAEDLFRTLGDDGATVNLPTVYRALGDLLEAGLVEKHNFNPGYSVFELTQRSHHDHLICVDCGKVIEFMDPVIEKRQEDLAKKHQLTITDHTMYLYGSCQRKRCPDRKKTTG